ncbi:MAG: hypothetical protein H7039_06310 [Bryobacteraceae bacterium]|nr:hypothetical protein [Bryobacteraceae bacterium]
MRSPQNLIVGTKAPQRSEGGRIVASVLEIPGVTAYGMTEDEAVRKVKAIALLALASKAPSRLWPDRLASGDCMSSALF